MTIHVLIPDAGEVHTLNHRWGAVEAPGGGVDLASNSGGDRFSGSLERDETGIPRNNETEKWRPATFRQPRRNELGLQIEF